MLKSMPSCGSLRECQFHVCSCACCMHVSTHYDGLSSPPAIAIALTIKASLNDTACRAVPCRAVHVTHTCSYLT